MSAFVGVKNVTADELEALVKCPTIALPSSYYFLRWFHKVSGIQMKLPDDFPSPEGQIFNSELELRWKQQGSHYEVLLLSKAKLVSDLNFTSLKNLSNSEIKWELCDRPAYFYDSDETKFPKGFLYQDAEGVVLSPKESPLKQVKQRYFRDAQTATIHFVALTVQ